MNNKNKVNKDGSVNISSEEIEKMKKDGWEEITDPAEKENFLKEREVWETEERKADELPKKPSLWEELKNIDFSNKQNLNDYLQKQWGIPLDDVQTNLLFELSKKIYSYYAEDSSQNSNTIHSLTGSIKSVSDIIEKKFKEGKRMGQTYYILKIGEEKIQALKENLEPEKWTRIEKLDLLGQNLVFKYKFWIKNKQLLDFYPYESDQGKISNENEIEAKQANSLHSKLSKKITGGEG